MVRSRIYQKETHSSRQGVGWIKLDGEWEQVQKPTTEETTPGDEVNHSGVWRMTMNATKDREEEQDNVEIMKQGCTITTSCHEAKEENEARNEARSEHESGSEHESDTDSDIMGLYEDTWGNQEG